MWSLPALLVYIAALAAVSASVPTAISAGFYFPVDKLALWSTIPTALLRAVQKYSVWVPYLLPTHLSSPAVAEYSLVSLTPLLQVVKVSCPPHSLPQAQWRRSPQLPRTPLRYLCLHPVHSSKEPSPYTGASSKCFLPMIQRLMLQLILDPRWKQRARLYA